MSNEHAIHVCNTCRDKPGSDTAREKGCICPVLDNGRGHRPHPMIFNIECPLHQWTPNDGPVHHKTTEGENR